MSGHSMRRFNREPFVRFFQAVSLRVGIILAGVPLLVGCGNSQGEKSSAPPAPAQAAPQAQAAPPARASKRDRDDEDAPAAAAQPVPEAPFDLAYLDADTELILFARPAAIVASPFVQAFTGGNLGPLDQMRVAIGIGVEQIDTVTVGVRNLQKMAAQSQQQFAQAALGFPGASLPGKSVPNDAFEDTIVVVRTVDPISAQDLGLMLPGDETTRLLTHQSKIYYSLAAKGFPQGNLYIANEKTLVIATEAAIKKLIELGEKVTRVTADLSFIDSAPEFALAVVPQDRQALFSTVPGLGSAAAPSEAAAATFGTPSGKGSRRAFSMRGEDDEDERGPGRVTSPNSPAVISQSNDLDALLAAHTDAVALLLKVDADLKLDVAIRCDGPQSAVHIKAMFGKSLNEAKQSFEEARDQLPGVIQQVADAVLGTIETASTDKVVMLSMTLPASQQANLTVLPVAIMGMMMGSTMGNMESMVDWQARAQEVVDRGQPAAAGDGLPSGLELRALARWGVPPAGQESSAVPLEVAIVATGEPAARAIAFGQLQLTEANVGDGARLKWLGAAQAENAQGPIVGFEPIDRAEVFPRHPAGGIATGFTFGSTGAIPSPIKVMAGSFSLKTASKVRDVTVNPLPPIGGTVEDDGLRAAGFGVLAGSSGGFTAVAVSYQDPQSIGDIKVLGADGNPITVISSSTTTTGGQVQRTISFAGAIDRAQLGLRVSLFEDVQEIPVAFRFEDLPVPAEDASEQKPLVTWIPGERVSGEIPDGLLVDARARWGSPPTGAFGGPNGGNLANNPFPGMNPPSGPTPTPLLGGGLLGRGREDDGDNDRRGGRRRRGDDEEDDRPPGGRGPKPGADRISPDQFLGSGKGNVAIPDEDDPSSFGGGLGAATASINPAGALQFAVDLSGPVAGTITSVGNVAVETAVSELGGELEYQGGVYGGNQITDRWVDVDSLTAASNDQPPDGVRVLVLFASPEPPIDRIAQFRGSLKVRTARDHVDAVVSNLNDRTDRKIKDRNLGKFGIVIAVKIEGNQLLFRLLEGKEDRIAEMYPVDRGGERIASVSHSTSIDNGNMIHVFDFQGPVPSRVGLKFSMNLGIQELEIPLRFHNVPVPPQLEVSFAPAQDMPAPLQPNLPVSPASQSAIGKGVINSGKSE